MEFLGKVIFENRNGRKYKNIQDVSFNPPKERILNNDMIEDDDINFYDNILLFEGYHDCGKE